MSSRTPLGRVSMCARTCRLPIVRLPVRSRSAPFGNPRRRPMPMIFVSARRKWSLLINRSRAKSLRPWPESAIPSRRNRILMSHGPNPKSKPLDNHTFKQEPPPAGSYPTNEVVAEATDLDGNHVVLRRGYYDERTQQGFGWDKAFWKHHVTNPNVFKDLISHSRPISSKDRTLVYEVPLNRVHCTQGSFGIADCEDTGESLTMRIVVNVNEGRAGIPDGGQKGAISMYPLAGGSGVVEVEPGWTLCPPWVNKNVPIN